MAKDKKYDPSRLVADWTITELIACYLHNHGQHHIEYRAPLEVFDGVLNRKVSELLAVAEGHRQRYKEQKKAG